MAKRQTKEKREKEYIVRDIPRPSKDASYVTLTLSDGKTVMASYKLVCGIILGECIEPDGSTSTFVVGGGPGAKQIGLHVQAPTLLQAAFNEVIERMRPSAPSTHAK